MTTSPLKPQYFLNTTIPQLRIAINQPKSKTQPIYQLGFFYTQIHQKKKRGFMVSSSSNNFIQKSKSSIIHTKKHSFHTSSILFLTFDLLLFFLLFSSSSSFFLFSLLFYPYELSKMRDQMVFSPFLFKFSFYLHFGPPSSFYLHFHLFKFLLWPTIFCSYVIWVLN